MVGWSLWVLRNPPGFPVLFPFLCVNDCLKLFWTVGLIRCYKKGLIIGLFVSIFSKVLKPKREILQGIMRICSSFGFH